MPPAREAGDAYLPRRVRLIDDALARPLALSFLASSACLPPMAELASIAMPPHHLVSRLLNRRCPTLEALASSTTRMFSRALCHFLRLVVLASPATPLILLAFPRRRIRLHSSS